MKTKTVKKMVKIFLGGTCNESKWRYHLIPKLIKNGIDYFDPVVDNWTPECRVEEIKQRKECDLVLYVITPKMTGVYSIAEVVDDSNKRPEKTLFLVFDSDEGNNGKMIAFDKGQMKSLSAVKEMVENNGVGICKGFNDVIECINNYRKEE